MPASLNKPSNTWLAILAIAASVLAVLPRALATVFAPWRSCVSLKTKATATAKTLGRCVQRRIRQLIAYVYWYSLDTALLATPTVKKNLSVDVDKAKYAYLPPPSGASRSPCPASWPCTPGGAGLWEASGGTTSPATKSVSSACPDRQEAPPLPFLGGALSCYPD